jgi:CubicO group peptidase (beta-lactamase class C family)
MKKISLFTIILLAKLTCFAQDPRAINLENLFTQAHQLGVFNGNVLISENGKPLYSASLGYTDASGKTKLDDTYRFNIGSIAKEFNAVAIMMLKEKGKLDLSDKVSKYLNELPQWADSISILNLLQYTSGVPNSKWNEITSDAVNLEALKKIKKLDFTPGTKYAYNNNNTFLQRQIIEKVTGISFNTFVKEKMLRPLGMTHAIVDPTEKDVRIARAYNNAKVEDGLTPPISGWTSLTTGDFLIWAKAISTYKLITPESTKQILYGFAPGNQAGLGGGLMEGKILVSHIHDGTTRNYQALLVTSSTKDRVIILLTNNQQNNLYPFSRSIQQILDGKPFADVKKSFLSTFRQDITNMDATKLLAFYNLKLKTNAQEFSFESEDSLNEIGYYFLRNGKSADALLIFKANTIFFPLSANVYDSLAEATLSTGDKVNALIYYKKALQLDPNLASAKQMVEELGKRTP